VRQVEKRKHGVPRIAEYAHASIHQFFCPRTATGDLCELGDRVPTLIGSSRFGETGKALALWKKMWVQRVLSAIREQNGHYPFFFNRGWVQKKGRLSNAQHSHRRRTADSSGVKWMCRVPEEGKNFVQLLVPHACSRVCSMSGSPFCRRPERRPAGRRLLI